MRVIPYCFNLTAFAFLALITLAAARTAAENIAINGVSFPVDSVAQVDGKTVRVQVGGQSSLVSREGLNDWIVGWYFAKPERLSAINSAQVKTFTFQSLREGNSVYAALGLTCLFEKAPELLTDAFLLDLERFPLVSQTLFSVLQRISAGNHRPAFLRERAQVLAAFLLTAGLNNPAWLRTNATSLLFLASDNFRELLGTRFDAVIAAGDAASANLLTLLAKEVLGSDDPLYRRFLNLTVLHEKITDIRRSGAVEEIYPLIEKIQSDKNLEVLYPHAATILNMEARAALEAGDAVRALQVVARSDLNRRTAQTHQLVREALALLKPGVESPLLDLRISNLLDFMGAKDSQISLAYLAALQQEIDYLLAVNKPEMADTILSLLIKIRPDPDHLNDRLRIEQAIVYLNSNRLASARRKISEIKTSLSVIERLRLGFSGLYFRKTDFLLLFIVFIGSSVSYTTIQVRKFIRRRSYKAAEVTGRIGFDPSYGEYLKCLEALGLNRSATIADIKRAFRRAMKRTHPDKRKETKATSQFVTLNEAYHRALALRKSLRLPDEEQES